MFFVGIDIAKVSFHMACLNQNGSVIFLMVTNTAHKLIRVIFAMVNNNLLFSETALCMDSHIPF